MTCSSIKSASQTCPFGFASAGIVLARTLSSAPCIQGSTWSSSSRSVTVKSGCRAEFKVAMKVERPRIVIMTDIGQDPDDTQSLVRLLLYANDLNIVGIIPTYRPGNRPVASDIVRSVINAYDQDRPRLLLHDIRYPQGSTLLSYIRDGLNNNVPIGPGYDTAGSDHIIAKVDASTSPTWVLVWGGSRELAQAIYKVRSTRSASAFASFQKKLRVYSIGYSQYTPEPGDYLAANAKEMFWIFSAHYEEGTRSATFRGMYLLGDLSMQKEAWITANIKNKGSLGAMYPLNSTESGMKEGDTPSFLHVLPIGLSDPLLPKSGGWGGRYSKEPEYYATSTNLYTSRYQTETLFGVVDRRNSVARWRPAFQADFAARANWLVATFANANHPPDAKIVGSTALRLGSGTTVTLDARPSFDPDGDPLSYRWWIYKEVNPFAPTMAISNAASAVATLTAPSVRSTQTVHLILAVKDNGSPALTRYQRVILTIVP